MMQATIMTETPQVRIAMNVGEELEAAAPMITVNAVLHAMAAAQHHQDMAAERNGLAMMPRLVKAILKVCNYYPQLMDSSENIR
jgi:hypothetical protein